MIHSAMKKREVFFVLSCLTVLCSAHHQLYILTLNGDIPVVTRIHTKNTEKYFKKIDDNILAKALLNPKYNETGWDFIEISTNERFSDEQQAYAAGYLEGSLTYDAIYKHWYNSLGDFCIKRDDACDQVAEFLHRYTEWIKDNIVIYAAKTDYWNQVKLFYKQLEGLTDGYINSNQNQSRSLRYRDLLLLNTPDLGDILEMIKANKSKFTDSDFDNNPKVLGLLRCSALIKVLEDGSELFSSQVAWSEYSSMMRSQKKYDFPFHSVNKTRGIIPGRAMTFSSYPGVLASYDDFYIITSGLVTMETTIGNSNPLLWKYVKPEGQVSEGVRSMVANRLAQNGRSWTKTFGMYNSGTYNNQWMVVDYKLFKKGTKPSKLPDELLWVGEQIPGYYRAEDMTSTLREQSYWPSYNVAYFKDVFNKSGDQKLVEKYGDWFTYERTPRALIFKRDHGKVKNLKTMMDLMRYNDFKHDPLARCNCTPPYSGENAIAARCDLSPANGSYPFPSLGHRAHGATDAKITSQSLILKGLQFLSVAGPPHNISRGIPPFQWSKTDFGNRTRHLGHPDIWIFKPLIYAWAQ